MLEEGFSYLSAPVFCNWSSCRVSILSITGPPSLFPSSHPSGSVKNLFQKEMSFLVFHFYSLIILAGEQIVVDRVLKGGALMIFSPNWFMRLENVFFSYFKWQRHLLPGFYYLEFNLLFWWRSSSLEVLHLVQNKCQETLPSSIKKSLDLCQRSHSSQIDGRSSAILDFMSLQWPVSDAIKCFFGPHPGHTWQCSIFAFHCWEKGFFPSFSFFFQHLIDSGTLPNLKNLRYGPIYGNYMLHQASSWHPLVRWVAEHISLQTIVWWAAWFCQSVSQWSLPTPG